MVETSDIGWGKYGGYEGPYFWGKTPFRLSDNPSESEKFLAVITATEGGKWDAINGYDRCINTVGLVQHCEAGMYGVSDLLGYIVSCDEGLLDPLKPAMAASDVTFETNARARWRFHFRDARGEVDRKQEQRQLFLRDSTGKLGTWDNISKEHAKLWVACEAEFLAQPGAIEAQMQYLLPRFKSYVFGSARKTMFGDIPTHNNLWVGAARAIYLSFSLNLPAMATRMLEEHIKHTRDPLFSEDWVIGLAKRLTFDPGIAIYPHRYNKIRPVAEKLYGVDLPDFSEELKKWRSDLLIEAPETGVPDFLTIDEIQDELLACHYDLGPAKADGRVGTKTRAAIMTFQRYAGLEDDGIVGKKTRRALKQSWEARN